MSAALRHPACACSHSPAPGHGQPLARHAEVAAGAGSGRRFSTCGSPPGALPRSGLSVPVAGRSPRPSWPRLSACPLRFGILPALAPIARLSGTGSPSLVMLKWPQVFNLRTIGASFGRPRCTLAAAVTAPANTGRKPVVRVSTRPEGEFRPSALHLGCSRDGPSEHGQEARGSREFRTSGCPRRTHRGSRRRESIARSSARASGETCRETPPPSGRWPGSRS